METSTTDSTEYTNITTNITTTNEDEYQRLDHISHVLQRSAMYTGSKTLTEIEDYVAESHYNEDLSIGYQLKQKKIISSRAILRIFVEVLSNAIDNVERSRLKNIPCTTIKVSINQKTGETSVWNDGAVIPIEIHKTEGIYIHSLIFGHLLSSSNYDDTKEKLVSGTYGCGVKLSNIFSTKFTVSGLDPTNKKTFEQTWTNNMRNTTDPIIKSTKLNKGWTQVTYFPDFSRFSIDGYTEDILSLYTRYIIDTAMLAKVKVYLNDQLLPVNNLLTYTKLYESPTEEYLVLKTSTSEVVITPSTGDFQAISFMNGVYTRLGGLHVDMWSETIFRPIVEKFNVKGKPQLNIKEVKQFFRLFIVSTVSNPEFSGQDKERFEGPKLDYLSVTISPSDIKKILKWSIMDEIDNIIKSKQMIVLKKTEKKKRGFIKIDGYDRANFADTKKSTECTLILCEGLSASSFAIEGISKGVYDKEGRDFFGVLALTGKMLNCLSHDPTQIAKNMVITKLTQALNLQHGMDYTKDDNYKTLSYGRVMIITDADCFADDTALLVKIGNKISVKAVEELFDENKNISSQPLENIEVWNSSGWTRLVAIRRKTTNKKILTINTHSGLVRCTEDHTFLLENGDEIKARDIKIGDKLMRTKRIEQFPNYIDATLSHAKIKDIMGELQCFNKSEHSSKKTMRDAIEKELSYCCEFTQPCQSKDFYNITPEEAWIWGFFFAGGTCGIHTFEKDTLRRTSYSFSISNCDKAKLEKSLDIVSRIYPDFNWTLNQITVSEEEHNDSYRLVLNGGKCVENFVQTMMNRFYTNKKLKKVPNEILNNSKEIQQAFYDGYYDGNGFCYLKQTKNAERFDILGQVGVQGLNYLVQQLGYSTNIRENNGKPNVFTIHLSKRYRRYDPNIVHSIYETK